MMRRAAVGCFSGFVSALAGIAPIEDEMSGAIKESVYESMDDIVLWSRPDFVDP